MSYEIEFTLKSGAKVVGASSNVSGRSLAGETEYIMLLLDKNTAIRVDTLMVTTSEIAAFKITSARV